MDRLRAMLTRANIKSKWDLNINSKTTNKKTACIICKPFFVIISIMHQSSRSFTTSGKVL